MVTILSLVSNQKQYINKIHPDVEALRYCLKQLNAWPEAGDEFLALIPQSYWYSAQPTEQDYQWLPLVVQDAVAGFDIGARYPSFFQKLLCLSRLRKDFLDELNHNVAAPETTKMPANHTL